MPILKYQNVSKSFGKKPILKNINLNINSGKSSVYSAKMALENPL